MSTEEAAARVSTNKKDDAYRKAAQNEVEEALRCHDESIIAKASPWALVSNSEDGARVDLTIWIPMEIMEKYL